MILTTFLAVLAVLSLALMIWQVIVAVRFPLHRRADPGEAAPAVTLLKPLKGAEAGSRECWRSWLTQEYPGPLQILFGVASADDPAAEVIRGLLAEHPAGRGRLVICGERRGLNRKVSQLIQLAAQAEHEILCVSDADVWAPPDYLSQAVVCLREPGVGLVNSFYRIRAAGGIGMRWEAFAVNADFWSQVLQALSLWPMDFALGASMVTSRRHLEAIGGFSALADHLADDYELGHRIARSGGRLAVCPVVVECRSSPMSFPEVWRHQSRWARTIRVCRPASFFWSILGNATFWPLLWCLAAPSTLSLTGCGVCAGFRMFAGLILERLMTGRFRASSAPMALLKDLLQVPIWAWAQTGNRITWRGVDYSVAPSGRLMRVCPKVVDGREPAADAGFVRGRPVRREHSLDEFPEVADGAPDRRS